MEKMIYKVPVTWEMMGYLNVLADTQEEAFNLADKQVEAENLPENGEYVEDTYSIDSDILSLLYEDSDAVLCHTTIACQSGQDMWNELRLRYNVEEAKRIVEEYLSRMSDKQSQDDPTGNTFRDELRQAMKKTNDILTVSPNLKIYSLHNQTQMMYAVAYGTALQDAIKRTCDLINNYKCMDSTSPENWNGEEFRKSKENCGVLLYT